MTNRKPDDQPKNLPPRASDKPRDAARRKARGDSIIGLAVVGFVTMIAALMLVARGGELMLGQGEAAASRSVGIILIGAGLALVVGLRYIMVAAIRRFGRDSDPRCDTLSKMPSAERPFDQRLTKYLEEQPTPAAGATDGHRSPMAFFLTFLPGPRRGPKTAGAIRKILLRIHRLLHNGT